MNIKLETLLKSKHLSSESISDICDSWNEEITLKKKDYLLRCHQREYFLYFIISGCVALVIEGENKNSVLGFGNENSIITSFISFSTGEPSNLSLIAIADTKMLKISKSALGVLTSKHLEILKWYHTIVEKTLIGHLTRQVELTTLSPKERYLLFMERSGHLVNTIPLKYISSYLNMTPETLSRIRASLS